MAWTATAAQPASRTGKIAKQDTLHGNLAGSIKAFAATELLFSLGDPKTELYLIESGVVAVYEPRLQGRQAIIELAFPGDIVGLGCPSSEFFGQLSV
jgi:CRP-like cAMP-binding protein